MPRSAEAVSTYHRPVSPLQPWLAVKPIVYTRNETSSNQKDNADIIKLVSESSNVLGVVGNCMISSRHA